MPAKKKSAKNFVVPAIHVRLTARKKLPAKDVFISNGHKDIFYARNICVIDQKNYKKKLPAIFFNDRNICWRKKMPA